MAVATMSPGSGTTPRVVDRERYSLQMGWIAAAPVGARHPARTRRINVVTGVVDRESFGDWSDEELVDGTVDSHMCRHAAKADHPITALVEGAQPGPALIGAAELDLRFEPVG